ncbi:MAG TPA: hypothetical protein PKD85_13410 [Saprospiraceae bacterium]|nr:hypothetical protein [Saprospiraceae bacterium]
MEGYKLIPLNQLKYKYPEIYKIARKKYKGREFVMEQKVPILDCLWNDVVHFSAVHPQKISDALKELGQELKIKRFYKINPNKLDPKKTVVYLYKHKLKKDKMLPSNWENYDVRNIEKYTELPNSTIKYYRDEIGKGNKPPLWAWVPHIMHQGEIDVSDCEIIEIE